MLVKIYSLTPEKVLDLKASLAWIRGTVSLIANNEDERYRQVDEALKQIEKELSIEHRYKNVDPKNFV